MTELVRFSIVGLAVYELTALVVSLARRAAWVPLWLARWVCDVGVMGLIVGMAMGVWFWWPPVGRTWVYGLGLAGMARVITWVVDLRD